jgi:hypothetical protein
MEPTENKPTHLYPNADRAGGSGEGGISTTPATQNLNQAQTSFGNNNSEGSERPLFHLSDVMQNPNKNQTSEPSNDPNSIYKTSSVHTFKDDLANESSKGGFSLGKIMAANNQKMHSSADNTTDFNKKNNHVAAKILVFIICILIIGGFAYIGFNSAKTPDQIELQKNPSQQVVNGILYSEISIPMFVQGKNRTLLINEILKESSIKFSSGKVKSISFNTTNSTNTAPILASEFLKIFAPSAPDLLLRNVKNEYVFGYYSYESNEPFIILKSTNYDSVFAGMLEWEGSMYADLSDFMFKNESVFSFKEPAVVQSSSTASTTFSTSSSPATTSSSSSSSSQRMFVSNGSEYDTPFVDKVVSNNDTRVLYRANGSIAFFYTFFNRDMVIIATSEQTLKELIYRLTSGKITR